MATLSMQGIAELARVKRPVVTTWRSRYAESATPFPEPVEFAAGGRLAFDALEVAEWLETTGRGKNPTAGVESVLHSDLLRDLQSDLRGVSWLLLLQHLAGEPLADLNPVAFQELSSLVEAWGLASRNEIARAYSNETLCMSVDAIAEAAFGGGSVLDRIVTGFVSVEGAWREDALTRNAEAFFGELLVDLFRSDTRPIVPIGVGGMVLASAMLGVDGADDGERPSFGKLPADLESPELTAAWCRVAARSRLDSTFQLPEAGGCRLLMMTRSQPHEFFSRVGDAVVDLAASDLLLVVGPATLMIGEPGSAGRRSLLVPHPDYVTPLRYAAQLPRGMALTGGRTQLAIWVFASDELDWTVFGDHSDPLTVDPHVIAADISAALSDRSDLYAHAFARSSVRRRSQLLRSANMASVLPRESGSSGGEILASIWQNQRELLDGIDLEVTPADAHWIGFPEAHGQFGWDIPGVRIATAEVEPIGPGLAPVIGPDAVRKPGRPSKQGISRLRLEEVAPRAQYTEPGDVIYVAQGSPSATVDRVGGNIVLAPARVFRCKPRPEPQRQLSPAVVAADISRMRTSDRRDWRLRTVAFDRLAALHDAMHRVETRQSELREEFQNLAVLKTSLIDGLADGSIAPSLAVLTNSPYPQETE